MKKLYLTLLSAVVLIFAACSDDDNMNSANATISFKNSEVTFLESAGMVNVPLVVEGERNGDIKVHLKATDGSAVETGHYLVTSTDINIPAGSEETTFNVEVIIYDDGTEENDDRTFTLSIESIEGAKAGQNESCSVKLKDVDKNPYFKLFGEYTATGIDSKSGETITFDVTISDTDGHDTYTEEALVCWGFPEGGNGYNPEAIWYLTYNKKGTLTLEPDNYYVAYNFGSFIGAVCVSPYNMDRTPSDARFVGTFNDTFDEITFDSDATQLLIGTKISVYNTSDGSIGEYAGGWERLKNLKLVKK